MYLFIFILCAILIGRFALKRSSRNEQIVMYVALIILTILSIDELSFGIVAAMIIIWTLNIIHLIYKHISD